MEDGATVMLLKKALDKFPKLTFLSYLFLVFFEPFLH
jgi:hypothetical protein